MAKRKAARPSPLQKLETELRELIASPSTDSEVLARMEELSSGRSFHSLIHVWGPGLYRRNRTHFRAFILAHLPPLWAQPGRKRDTAALETWLRAADEAGDVELFRRLYAWTISDAGWNARSRKRWCADLLAAFRAAKDSGARAAALEKYEQPWAFDPTVAVELYETDPRAAQDFLLRRVPTWGPRKGWQRLLDLAQERGDEFASRLYRKLVSAGQWQKDVLRLCEEVEAPEELVAALERHHPEGLVQNAAEVFYRLAEKRQRDVVPYVLRHLNSVTPWMGGGKAGYFGRLHDLARDSDWLDLWSAMVRAFIRPEDYNRAVVGLLDDPKLDDEARFRRLILLAGAGREWAGGGRRGGWRQVQRLNDKTAVAVYEQFPELLQGPFRQHLLLEAWNAAGYPKLVAAARRAGDDAVVDHLASITLIRPKPSWHRDKGLDAFTELLAEVYRKLLKTPAEFSRRAANVLGLLPASAVGRQYRQLLRTNPLARLFFEEARDVYLDAPEVFRDLLESPVGYVQALALRALARDDDRARESAARNLDVLQATLLRSLHRRTRLWAFRALLGAAVNLENARIVHDRARQALDLPDRHYPKDRLIGLIGRLLHRWPELRSAHEVPVVYECRALTSVVETTDAARREGKI
jgi:hypothetical protein